MHKEIPDFLREKLVKQYGEEMTCKIAQGYEKKRPVTLRVNTLKATVEAIKQQLTETGIGYDEVPWSKEALVIQDVREEKIRELPMYAKGEIYLQSLSSMLPPVILNPKEGISILDMAAAPGGKTTQLAALTHNNAQITACEMNAIRAERLQYNIEKQGASSVYIMVTDARRLDDYFSFDSILLDAPCSGSGTIIIPGTDFEKGFTEKLVAKSVKAQTELIKKAISVLKSGGELVYSTCSILQEENEEIVEQILKNNRAEIIPIDTSKLEGLLTLPVSIEGTVCVCPNELYEGFYIAKLRKK